MFFPSLAVSISQPYLLSVPLPSAVIILTSSSLAATVPGLSASLILPIFPSVNIFLISSSSVSVSQPLSFTYCHHPSLYFFSHPFPLICPFPSVFSFFSFPSRVELNSSLPPSLSSFSSPSLPLSQRHPFSILSLPMSFLHYFQACIPLPFTPSLLPPSLPLFTVSLLPSLPCYRQLPSLPHKISFLSTFPFFLLHNLPLSLSVSLFFFPSDTITCLACAHYSARLGITSKNHHQCVTLRF